MCGTGKLWLGLGGAWGLALQRMAKLQLLAIYARGAEYGGTTQRAQRVRRSRKKYQKGFDFDLIWLGLAWLAFLRFTAPNQSFPRSTCPHCVIPALAGIHSGKQIKQTKQNHRQPAFMRPTARKRLTTRMGAGCRRFGLFGTRVCASACACAATLHSPNPSFPRRRESTAATKPSKTTTTSIHAPCAA